MATAAEEKEKLKSVDDLFEQAMKNYELALKTGVKLQEESAKMWTNILSQASTPQDLGKKVKAWSDDCIPQTQKVLEEYVKLIEQNSRTSVDLLKKAVATCQAATAQEAQSRFLSLWETSLGSLRDAAVAITQANARVADSVMGYARKAWEAPAGKA